ncbi:hypothetical protein AYB34_17010 [Leptospira sp. ZV016]|nr:hypothetical protein AYB34_17010 [Leptospira sp. ZV016]KXZ29429.1 hypothetical protein AYB32_10170 [Leptospira kirschneri]
MIRFCHFQITTQRQDQPKANKYKVPLHKHFSVFLFRHNQDCKSKVYPYFQFLELFKNSFKNGKNS